MSNILDRIAIDKRHHVAACKQAVALSTLEQRVKEAAAPKGFYRQLYNAQQQGRFGLITEIKKASPSRGLIREDFNPSRLARGYESGGATCLSILTDEPYFQGSDDDFIAVRATSSLPLLRKDFIIDPYQIVEARALGADCILLIMALLDPVQAQELEQVALALGLDVLIETHDEAEMAQALKLKSPLIGINNRNLKTFEVSLEISLQLAQRAGPDRLLVSESGIFCRDDLETLRSKAGINCFLVGESLMRQQDVTMATRTLTEG